MDKRSVEYNNSIKSDRLKVISETGQLIGEMTKAEAIRLAEEKEMDVVVCAPNAMPPVAKLCFIDKYFFELNKKEKQIKKNTKQMELKKIKLGINIDKNDLKTKLKQATGFIEDGNMVMFFIRFKRKEMQIAEKGLKVLKTASQALGELATISKDVAMEKNVASLTLRPASKKK